MDNKERRKAGILIRKYSDLSAFLILTHENLEVVSGRIHFGTDPMSPLAGASGDFRGPRRRAGTKDSRVSHDNSQPCRVGSSRPADAARVTMRFLLRTRNPGSRRCLSASCFFCCLLFGSRRPGELRPRATRISLSERSGRFSQSTVTAATQPPRKRCEANCGSIRVRPFDKEGNPEWSSTRTMLSPAVC